jgi:hypothetical protein
MARRHASSLDFPLAVYCRGCDASQPVVFRHIAPRLGVLGIQVECGQCARIALLIDGQGRTLCPNCEESVRTVAEVAARGAYAWISCPECTHTLVTLYGLSAEACARLGMFAVPKNR